MKNIFTSIAVLITAFILTQNIKAAVNTVPSSAVIETGYTVQNGHIVYPLPSSGYSKVIEVGPGKAYTELHHLPIDSLVGGTLLKIFYRAEPYRTKVFLRPQCTQNAKLRIQGIPDASGNLPIISANTDSTLGITNQFIINLGAIIIAGSYGQKPSWIDIVNLHLKDGSYSGIYVKGDNISVKGCILENNANGVFSQATNSVIEEITTNLLIEGCRFIGNGTVGDYRHHNIYSQGIRSTIQFNTIETLRKGAPGSTLKDRSSHTIIRYNFIETSARAIDLVEPEDTYNILSQDSTWDDTYVYGNMISNDRLPDSTYGSNMVHYGYDNSPNIRRRGNLYFANNTIEIKRRDNIWNFNLFDINSIEARLYFLNNIVVGSGYNNFNIFRTNNTGNCGHITFGKSWIIQAWNLTPTAMPVSDFSMTGQANIVTGTAPGWLAGGYFPENNSPCRASGDNITNSPYNLSVEFMPIYNDKIEKRTDFINPDLGCFSSAPVSNTSQINDLSDFSLKSYPNPFSETTTISFNLNVAQEITINVYNNSGQVVRDIVSGYFISGTHNLTFNAESIEKGLYYCVLKHRTGISTTKLLVK